MVKTENTSFCIDYFASPRDSRQTPAPIPADELKRNCIGNMTYQEAADFAGEVMPKIVIPGHWDMFAHNSADPKEFEDYINIKYEGKLNCKIPKLMEKISY